MGRRYTREPILDGTEPVEGVVTKGKVFFEKPVLQLVGKAEAEPPRSYHGSNPAFHGSNRMPEIPKGERITPVRLKSSHNTAICQHLPKENYYDLPINPNYHEVKEYLAKKRIEGFGQGAVVARRFQMEWRFKTPPQWGFLKYEIENVVTGTDFAPYRVMWFDTNINIDQEEKAWAEDLVVVHAAVDKSLIKDIMEHQGITFNFAFG